MLSTPFQSQYFCPPTKATVFGLLAPTLVAFVVLGFLATSQQLPVKPLTLQGQEPSNIADVSFTMEVISADPISRMFIMDWTPGFGTRNSSAVADIYMDPGLLDPSSVFLSSDPSVPFSNLSPYRPLYRLNASEPESYHSFRTIAKLRTAQTQGTARSTIQSYPFDEYLVGFLVYALDHHTGESIRLNVTRSFGVAVNFDVTLQTVSVDPPPMFISLQVKRSQAIQAFVILTIVTNWLITIAFLIISVATMIYTPHGIYQEMFVVPIATLFAFTSVRANLPGAPVGFGAEIDLYSILPGLVITGLCSFFLLLRVLYGRIRENIREGKSKRPQLSVSSGEAMGTSASFAPTNELQV